MAGVISKIIGAGLKKATKTNTKKIGTKSAAGKRLAAAQKQYDKMKAGLSKTKFKNEEARAAYVKGMNVYKTKLTAAKKAYQATTVKGVGGRKPEFKKYLTTDPITRKKYEVGSKVFDAVKKVTSKKKPMATKKEAKEAERLKRVADYGKNYRGMMPGKVYKSEGPK